MNKYQSEIQKRAIPLEGISSLEPLIEKMKDKKVVMLGESSHGTHEFYEWRKKISLELIKNHGFNFIAVEGDWPACSEANQFVQARNTLQINEVMNSFSRWPTWMWANEEVRALFSDLRDLNEKLEKKAGFFGLDVYSLFDSIDVLVNKVKSYDYELAIRVAKLYECFEPYKDNEMKYVRSLLNYPSGCEDESVNLLQVLLEERLSKEEKYGIFDSAQNARVIRNAERYYRSMVYGDGSWNIRDNHMLETLEVLLQYYGPLAKGIVWAHNTHVGDYRATDMLAQGDVNLGGLAREKLGAENVFLAGLTTYKGSVIASTGWDGPILRQTVPESPSDTVENLFHELVPEIGPDYYVLMDEEAKKSELSSYKGHRAIGVVYNPGFERGNYVPTSLSHRYDAFVFLDETTGLAPVTVSVDKEKMPETYPFGNKV